MTPPVSGNTRFLRISSATHTSSSSRVWAPPWAFKPVHRSLFLIALEVVGFWFGFIRFGWGSCKRSALDHASEFGHVLDTQELVCGCFAKRNNTNWWSSCRGHWDTLTHTHCYTRVTPNQEESGVNPRIRLWFTLRDALDWLQSSIIRPFLFLFQPF